MFFMDAYRFGRFSDSETPHVTGLPVEEVFSDSVEENGNWFLPLIAIDLSELNPDWDGYVHFLYGGTNVKDIHFTLRHEDDNTLLAYDGEYDFDEEGMAEREVKQGYMEFIEVEEPPQFDAEDWLSHVDSLQAALDDIDDDLSLMCHIGGRPLWTQSDDTPQCASCDKEMAFVGQMHASDFSDDVGDYDLYLFYCHHCQIQTQINQTT